MDSAHAEKVRLSIDNSTLEISIGVTPDNLRALLSIKPSKTARAFEAREIFEMLEEGKISFGIKRSQIQKTINQVNLDLKPVRDQLIAVGEPIKEGLAPRIQYHFKTDRKVEFGEDESGKVDFKDLGYITNVNSGDLLAEYIEGTPSEPGTDIFGKTIEPEPYAEPSIQPGAFVSLSNDGKQCFASENGQAYLKNGRVTVSTIFKVAGDVDLNVGNIDFNGSIKVAGNVLAGFHLKANGNITISGLVEGASLEAEGSIIIKGGIKGADKGQIIAGGDLITTFIESGDILCKGNLFIESSIVNSKIECHKKISAIQGKGSIVAGDVFAVSGLECLELGSKIGVPTKVVVGDKPIIRKRLEELAAKTAPFQNEHKQISLAMEQHSRLFEQIEFLEPAKKAPLLTILMKKKELEKKLAEFDGIKAKLISLFNAPTLARVKVHRITHPNTSLTIGHLTTPVKLEYKNSCFSENPATKGLSVTPVR